MNSAFVFIKPHAVTEKITAYTTKYITDANLKITDQGMMTSKDMENIVDFHYGQLAQRATKIDPSDLPAISPEALAKFKETFGVDWDEAKKVHAAEAMILVKEPSAKDFEAKWRAGPFVKLFPGTYIAKVTSEAGDDIYAVNGFYPYMREKFTCPIAAPNGIQWFIVEWESNLLSWSAFREEIIGATTPSKAIPSSLRGYLFKNWEELGLKSEPSGADNGFHGSASPLEAFHERQIWLKTKISDDPFSKVAGVDEETLKGWALNPMTKSGQPIFDVVELMDTAECVKAVLEAGC